MTDTNQQQTTKYPFVARIEQRENPEAPVHKGSGVLISPRHVLTCHHVIKVRWNQRTYGARLDAAALWVQCGGQSVGVTKISDQDDLDLAVLELRQPICGVEPVTFIDELREQGELAEFLNHGWAMILGYRQNTGRVAVHPFPFGRHIYDDQNVVTTLSFDQGAYHGASGGPVIIHDQHQVYCIGLAYQGGEDSKKTNAIPSNDILSFIGKNNMTAVQTVPADRIPWRRMVEPVEETAQVRDPDLLTRFYEKYPNQIDDAIEIDLSENLGIAELETAYNEEYHEYSGQFLVSANQARFTFWTAAYPRKVTDFIQKNIEKASTGNREAAKLGFVRFRHDHNACGHGPPLVVTPINHLVTFAFNRMLALDRLKHDAAAEGIWWDVIEHNNSGSQMFEMNIPSQIFIELGLVTSDGYIPITHKPGKNSVYAHRNNKNTVMTCGIEFGPDWRDLVRAGSTEREVMLDIKPAVIKGLDKEFPMRAAGGKISWEEQSRDIFIKLNSFVVQKLHFNAALLGYCRVPFTKSDLFAAVKSKIPAGGLDHSNLTFVHVSECRKMIEKYQDSIEWHGTALMRLSKIAEDFY